MSLTNDVVSVEQPGPGYYMKISSELRSFGIKEYTNGKKISDSELSLFMTSNEM